MPSGELERLSEISMFNDETDEGGGPWLADWLCRALEGEPVFLNPLLGLGMRLMAGSKKESLVLRASEFHQSVNLRLDLRAKQGNMDKAFQASVVYLGSALAPVSLRFGQGDDEMADW